MYANFVKPCQKVQGIASFTFFRNWTATKPRPIPNDIWQSHGLQLVIINLYAKFRHNIPFSSRDWAIFTFLEFGARQGLTDEKCHFAISWARSCQYQCLCKRLSNYSKRFKSYGHFSLLGQNLHKLSGDKIKCLFIGYTLKVNLQFRLTFWGSCNRTHSK